MDKEEKYSLYDRIISVTYTNLFNAINENKKLYLNSFVTSSYIDKVFLKTALMIGSFNELKIVLNCRFRDYIKLLFSMYKLKQVILRRHLIRWTSREHQDGVDIVKLARIEVEDFNVHLDVFEEIWETYYEDNCD